METPVTRKAATPWDDLPTSGCVVDTLGAAFWGLLFNPNFEDSLVMVVNRGGDADTCGAVAGALCGALYGWQGIPERWLARIERRGEIEREVARVLG